MAFDARDLDRPLDSIRYRAQIDSNMEAIEQQFGEVATALAGIPAQPTQSDLSWLYKALAPDGVVGYDTLPLTIDTQSEVIRITPKVNDQVMIGGVLHIVPNTQRLAAAFSALPTSSGLSVRVAIGLASNGAPNTTFICAVSVDSAADVAAGIQLLLYECLLFEEDGSYAVTGIRRGCPVLMDGAAFDRAIRPIVPMELHVHGALPTTTGYLAHTIVVPFPCLFLGAYSRLGTKPPQNQNVTAWVYGVSTVTGAVALSDAGVNWGYSTGDGVVKWITPKSPYPKLEAGTVLRGYLSNTSPTPGATELSFTILLKPEAVP